MSRVFNLDVSALIATAELAASEGKTPEEIISLYNDWLSANGNNADAHPIWFNFGTLLSGQGMKGQAIECYKKALGLNPSFWQAAANTAHVLETEGKVAEAIQVYEAFLDAPTTLEGRLHMRNQLGRLYEGQRNFPRASELYYQSLCLKPDQDGAFQHWFSLKQKQCDWPLETFVQSPTARKLAEFIGPIGAMAYFDDPELLHHACSSWIERFSKGKNYYPMSSGGYGHKKLRVGYVSCDFRAHACCFLYAQMFAAHDREKFEVYGFDFSKEEQSVWRQMCLGGMDKTFAIHQMTDEEAAKLLRSMEIDILVDLVGLTSGARPGIFRYKPAPIQVSYLGFLGPTGIPEIDYIVCDDYVVPPHLAQHYGAKPLYVPFYQVNNQLRAPSEKPTRASQGLPEDGFVFCAINNSYKLTPAVFARWMRILERSPNSVLWLLEENPSVKENILREAKKYDVAPERLIFAKHVMPNDYLARFQCADLFLDTSPYNAGITASDAIWVGLPVLTCPGNTLVSRMAADLMIKLGLDDLVCKDWEEYIRKAIEYAETGKARDLVAARLDRKSFVFDTRFFVKSLERKYFEIGQDI